MTDSPSGKDAPSHASLPSSITVEDLSTAIARSGYPLQGSVANKLWTSFNDLERYPTMQEEWAYSDTETNQVRSIDIFAELPLLARRPDRSPRVSPYVNLLIECKQSEMPYVFFLRSQSPSQVYGFPEISGLPSPDLTIFMQDEAGVKPLPYSMSLHDTLAFWDVPFFTNPCLLAISVAKAARKGKFLELTGEEAYRALTLPLMKAADHLKRISLPADDANYFTFRMVVCMAVLRAPMFGTFRRADEEVIQPLPWVRVCRLEPWQSGLRFGTTSNVRYYDVVHEDYVPEYMASLIESSKIIARRVERVSDVLANGKGVSNMDDETTYGTLRAIGQFDALPDELGPQFRVARLASSFDLPQEADPDGTGGRP